MEEAGLLNKSASTSDAPDVSHSEHEEVSPRVTNNSRSIIMIIVLIIIHSRL